MYIFFMIWMTMLVLFSCVCIWKVFFFPPIEMVVGCISYSSLFHSKYFLSLSSSFISASLSFYFFFLLFLFLVHVLFLILHLLYQSSLHLSLSSSSFSSTFNIFNPHHLLHLAFFYPLPPPPSSLQQVILLSIFLFKFHLLFNR